VKVCIEETSNMADDSGVYVSNSRRKTMICEGCIKQDTCKFREVVEEYEVDKDNYKLPLPLMREIYCPHKELAWPNWDTYTPYPGDTTTDAPVSFTYTS